jgi:hypothetical protein
VGRGTLPESIIPWPQKEECRREGAGSYLGGGGWTRYSRQERWQRKIKEENEKKGN